MKEKLLNTFNSLFSILIMLSIIGGGIVFVMFVIAIILGGNTGEILSTMASKTIMPYFIRFAALGMLAGLILIYTSGEHYLDLKGSQE